MSSQNRSIGSKVATQREFHYLSSCSSAIFFPSLSSSVHRWRWREPRYLHHSCSLHCSGRPPHPVCGGSGCGGRGPATKVPSHKEKPISQQQQLLLQAHFGGWQQGATETRPLEHCVSSPSITRSHRHTFSRLSG